MCQVGCLDMRIGSGCCLGLRDKLTGMKCSSAVLVKDSGTETALYTPPPIQHLAGIGRPYNYSCVFGKRNYRVLVRVCVCVCVCVCVSVFVCVFAR